MGKEKKQPNQKEEVIYIENYYLMQTVYKARIKLVKAKESDWGLDRYFKIFLEKLANEPEEKKEFIKVTLFNLYVQDENSSQLKKLVDLSPDDKTYVLEVASKCPPEVRQYFNDIFAGGHNHPATGKSLSDNENKKKGVSGHDCDIVMDRLNEHLKTLEPVFADIRELSKEELSEDFPKVKIAKKKSIKSNIKKNA